MEIMSNIEHIKQKVEIACNRVGRRSNEVEIVAVTKTVDVDRINEALRAGIFQLGENRVQELLSKYDSVKNAHWHLIGHLQTNKVKYIIDKVDLIHSVDSIALVDEISNRAKLAGKITNVLLQVNVSGEESKFGIAPQDLPYLMEHIGSLDGIKALGLMTIAPLGKDSEESRPHFRNLYKIFIDIKQKKYNNIDMRFLSMGMSGDFEVAIEEGSNIIRVGSAIFGLR